MPDVMEKLGQSLIQHGADLSAKDSEGNTPLVLAEKKDHADCVALLRAHSSDK